MEPGQTTLSAGMKRACDLLAALFALESPCLIRLCRPALCGSGWPPRQVPRYVRVNTPRAEVNTSTPVNGATVAGTRTQHARNG